MDKFVLEKIISDSSDIEFFSSSEAEPDTQNLMLKITEKEIEDCIKILVNNHWQKPGKLPEGHAVLSSYKILSLSYTIMDDTNKKLIRDIISKQYVPSSSRDNPSTRRGIAKRVPNLSAWICPR